MISKKSYGSYGSIDAQATTTTKTTQSSTVSMQSYQSGYGIYEESTSTQKKSLFGKSASSNQVDDLSNRMGSIHDKYYDVAKKHRDESGYVWKAIQDMIQYLVQIVTERTKAPGDAGYEQADVHLDPEKKKFIDKYRSHVMVPYNANSEAHETLLLTFWSYCMGPEVALESRVSEQWKEIGFQGKDPQTDFRAAGIFSLMNLLYFAEVYQRKFKRMLTRTQEERNGYPFAIAGISVTMLLLEILGIHRGKTESNVHARKCFIELLFSSKQPLRLAEENSEHFKSFVKSLHKDAEKNGVKETQFLNFDTDNDFIDFDDVKKEDKPSLPKKRRLHKKYNCVFEELFVTTFILLDTFWWQTSAHYFQFPDILKMTKKKIESLLHDEFTDLRDIRRYNKKITGKSRK